MPIPIGTLLLPPLAQGPITPISPGVLVSNLVPGVTVTLYADGAPLTPTLTANAASVTVPLAKPLGPGQKITANQSNPADPSPTGASAQSSPPVVVIPVPTPLGAPAYVSAVSTCVDLVLIDGVLPGATVSVKQGSTTWNAVAPQSPCWVNLTGVGAFSPGAILDLSQSAGSIVSPTVPSYPLAPATRAPTSGQGLLGPPTIDPPLLACQTALNFEHMVASLDVQVINGTTNEEFGSIAQSFPATSAPLQKGDLTAHQFSTRCGLTGTPATFTVTVDPPQPPTLAAPVCPKLGWISLANLVPGAVVFFSLVWEDGAGATESVPWGYAGVPPASPPSSPPWPFYLGALPSEGPKGETSLIGIQAEQILCPWTDSQRVSGQATFPVVSGGGPFPPPDPPANLYDCARAIRVTGAHLGSRLQAMSPSVVLSDPMLAYASEVTIKLRGGQQLAAGEQVFVQQTGCNADGTSSPAAIVKALPSSLPAPGVVAPVQAGATSVLVDAVVPGARVSLFVNGLLRSSVDSVDVTATLPAGWPPLTAGDSLTAAQAICSEVTSTNASVSVTVAANPLTAGGNTQRLLIVAPDVFMTALAPLVDHKNKTGMPANAVSIESLRTYFAGADDQEVIKRAILYAFENLATKYVMLAGDAHSFPVRYRFMHGLSNGYPKPNQTVPVPTNGSYVPSENYYANLYHHTGTYPALTAGPFDNWDANGNGLYNEGTWLVDALTTNPDNVDAYPDLAVARVPAHSPTDVTAFVNKVIAYETTSRPIQFTFVADQLYPDATGLINSIIDNSGLLTAIEKSQASYLEIEVKPPATASPGWETASQSDVAASANTSSWVVYLGHGAQKEWGHSGTYFVEEYVVDGTSTSTSLPVVFSSGCETGQFISGHPWGQEYLDVNGFLHNFVVVPGSVPLVDGKVIEDTITKQYWGLGPGVLPLPLTVPPPNAYDYDVSDRCFAYSWLIKAAPGGAIAYFGEVGVGEATAPKEIETYMLAAYVGNTQPILGDLYLSAQQQYWNQHHDDDGLSGDYHAVPRFYLGWLCFFGDPSLRLPVL